MDRCLCNTVTGRKFGIFLGLRRPKCFALGPGSPPMIALALVFSLNFYMSEFSRQCGVRSELRKRILRRFREEQLPIPFPTRTVLLDGKHD